jgi:hypothetical protein
MLPIEKIREDSGRLRREVKSKTFGYIVGAFGLIVGLAWNDAVKSLIEYWLPAGGNGIVAKFIYAVIITLLVVTASYYLIGSEAKKDAK